MKFAMKLPVVPPEVEFRVGQVIRFSGVDLRIVAVTRREGEEPEYEVTPLDPYRYDILVSDPLTRPSII